MQGVPSYVSTLLGNILVNIVNPLILLLLGVAIAAFVWGMVEFIQGADGDEGRAKGKRHMVWGLVGLFIMVSVFGIMCLIATTLNLPFSITSQIPFC